MIILSNFVLTEKEILEKCESKELTKVNSEPTKIDIQVRSQ